MSIPPDDLMRLLVEIDQQLADLRDLLERPAIEMEFDERTKVIYRMVCLEAARRMAEDKLNSGIELPEDDWFTLLSLYRLSNSWFG